MYLRTVEFDGVLFTTALGVSVMFLQLGCNYFQWNDTCGFCTFNIFLKCREILFQDVDV
jgi:hypothetical protein